MFRPQDVTWLGRVIRWCTCFPTEHPNGPSIAIRSSKLAPKKLLLPEIEDCGLTVVHAVLNQARSDPASLVRNARLEIKGIVFLATLPLSSLTTI